MRVLHWLDDFSPSIGGMELMVDQLTGEFASRGHELAVVTDQVSPRLAESELRKGVLVRRCPTRRVLTGFDIKALASQVKVFKEIILSFQPDVHHLHLGNMVVPFAFSVTTHDSHIPCVATVHGIPPFLTAAAGALRRILSRADRVVAVSNDTRAALAELDPGLSTRLTVIRNALRPPGLPFSSVRTDPPVVLYVGRLSAIKGVDLAIRALPSIANSVPSVQLLVVGDGEQRQELGQLAQDLNVSERVAFEGWVDPAMIFQYIDKATLVIVPSRAREGLPLVALQAAQRGRPVVAAGVGGLAEVVLHGETGLLFEAERIDRLATAVIELLTNSLLCSEMGSRAAESVRCRFSLSTHLESYEKVYLSALEAAKGN